MLRKVISIILIGTILAGCAPVLVDQQVETKQERNTDLQLDPRYDRENDEVLVTATRRFTYNNYSRNKDIYVTRYLYCVYDPIGVLLGTAVIWGMVYLAGLSHEGKKKESGGKYTRHDTIKIANIVGGLVALVGLMPHPDENADKLKSMYKNGLLEKKYDLSKIIKEEAGSWKLTGSNENKYAASDLPVSLTIPADYSDKLSVDKLRSLTDKNGKTSFKLNPNPEYLDKQSSGSGAKYVDLALRAENTSARVSAGPYRIKQPSPSAPVASYRNETASNQESSISESTKKMPEFETSTVPLDWEGKQYSALKKDKRNNVILRINPDTVRDVHLNGRPAANVLGSYMVNLKAMTGRPYYYMIGSLKSGSYYLSYDLVTEDGKVNVVDRLQVSNTQKETPLGGRSISLYGSSGLPPMSEYFKIMDPIMGASKAYKAYKLANGIAEMLYSSDDKYKDIVSFGDYFKAANVLYKDSDLRSRKMDEVWKQIERVQKGYTNALEAKQTIDQILGL